MIVDYFKYGISNLKTKSLRTWLTMIGIFIGMAAVVSLVSLGQGLQASVNEQFEKMGVDKLIIQSKGMFGVPQISVKPLTEKDFDVIKKTTGIEDVTKMLVNTAKIEFNDKIRYFMVIGMIPEDKLISEMYDTRTAIGRGFKKEDKAKILLGNDFLNEDLFGKSLKLRDTILVNDEDFKVVGFYKSLGNKQDDQQIYLPFDTMKELYDSNDKISMIFAKTSNGLDPEKVAKEVEKNLRKEHGVEEGNEDFTIQTSKELFESFAIVLNILQIFLVGIAAISLIVGGIGIMNTMYTAVLERTREIGIMKSIGAKNSDILSIFLIESGILGLIGGAIGVILGIGFSKLVEAIAANAGYSIVKVSFPLFLIIGTLLFALIVGVIAGSIPAYRASKLKPVDALRYE